MKFVTVVFWVIQELILLISVLISDYILNYSVKLSTSRKANNGVENNSKCNVGSLMSIHPTSLAPQSSLTTIMSLK